MRLEHPLFEWFLFLILHVIEFMCEQGFKGQITRGRFFDLLEIKGDFLIYVRVEYCCECNLKYILICLFFRKEFGCWWKGGGLFQHLWLDKN